MTPGTPGSVHLRDIPPPELDAIPNGRGVLVKTLQVGVDATDREINEALYGNSPPGDDYLVLGHECFGVVEAVGDNVTHVVPGDYVTCTVRRPGGSIYDQIGRSDITSEEVYYERGINLLHGFLTERFVDDAEFIVRVPPGLKHLGVLAEPMSVSAKAVQQAFDAQQRFAGLGTARRVRARRGSDRSAVHVDSAIARHRGLHTGPLPETEREKPTSQKPSGPPTSVPRRHR